MSEPNTEVFDYILVCQIVGQLFLDSRLRIEHLNRKVEQLTEERNQALSLLSEQPDEPAES